MALVKYNGDDMRRAYGVEMQQGDTHEFTDEQAAHLTRLPEFEIVEGEVVKKTATPQPTPPKPYDPSAKPKAKRIGASKGKKK